MLSTKKSVASRNLAIAASGTIKHSIHSFDNFLENKNFPLMVVLLIYFLSMIFTSPTRHGADRHYLLALNIVENHSINIEGLKKERNHYALVSQDLFKFNDGMYNNLHPGQALLGVPGLWTYKFVLRINNVENNISMRRNTKDKLDFIFGTYAMNMTSSALLTAIAAMFFIYLADKSFSIQTMKLLKISVFILLLYLSTPLFYYSTHIIQNQSESSLAFISLGLLCLGTFNMMNKKVHAHFFLSGLFIGLAFLVNASSLILLPFGVMHILLSGFVKLDFWHYKNLWKDIRNELNLNVKQKIISLVFLSTGFLLPTLVLLYYQYQIFSNPFIPVQSYLSAFPQIYSPTWKDYGHAFVIDLFDNLFSPKVGLFSYTPVLAFPILIWITKAGFKNSSVAEQETPHQLLRKMLFRTMILVLPLYITFYSLTGAKGFAEMGWEISQYNLYSARHILPIVLPLGYILLDSLMNMNDFTPPLRWGLWSILLVLCSLSLMTNVAATLIGDWIFSLNQVWGYIHYLFVNGYGGLMNQGRSLVDW